MSLVWRDVCAAKATCAFCRMECKGWKSDEDPWERHKTLSPNCRLVRCAKVITYIYARHFRFANFKNDWNDHKNMIPPPPPKKRVVMISCLFFFFFLLFSSSNRVVIIDLGFCIQTHKTVKRFKRTLFIGTKHCFRIFGVIPFIKLQTDTKTTVKPLICFGLSYAILVSSAWKNVGMTMTCNRCDVINIVWGKTHIAQKSDREEEEGRRQTDRQTDR